jgi:UDP-N-acetyl-D-mannosaminuronate dehydrogenase
VVVVTDHSQYDWNVVREKTGLLVDTRPAAKRR